MKYADCLFNEHVILFRHGSHIQAKDGTGDETQKAALLALEEQPLKTVSRLYNIPTRTLRRHRDSRVFTRGALALGPKKPALPTTAERTLRDHITRAVGFNRPKVHHFFELFRSQLDI